MWFRLIINIEKKTSISLIFIDFLDSVERAQND